MFLLLLALGAPARRRRRPFDPYARMFGQTPRPEPFTPNSINPNKGATLTFSGDWKLPFQVKIDDGPPIDGRLDRKGRPVVSVPPLTEGDRVVSVFTDGKDWRRIGILYVDGRIDWFFVWKTFFGIAILVALVYSRHRHGQRKRRQHRSDDPAARLPADHK